MNISKYACKIVLEQDCHLVESKYNCIYKRIAVAAQTRAEMVFLGHSIVFYYSSLWMFYATVLTDIPSESITLSSPFIIQSWHQRESPVLPFPFASVRWLLRGEFPLTADGLAPPPHMSASCRCVKNADGPVSRRRCLRAGAFSDQSSAPWRHHEEMKTVHKLRTSELGVELSKIRQT